MATKTITLDLEAYELLRRHKKGRQSFSQVVKEHFRPRTTVGDFRQALQRTTFEEETLDRVEAEVERRQRDAARPVDL